VLAASGYLKELEDSEDPQDQTRVENLAELVAVAREFSDEPVAGPGDPADGDPADGDPGDGDPGDGDGTDSGAAAGHGLAEFLERVALVADTDQIPDGKAGVVTLMTLHTAKGLEFPVVFLTGLEEGTFPHQRSIDDPSQLEEERRLAYVGVTRAQQRLYVSRAVVRSAWGAPVHAPESRFVGELPVDLVDWRRTQADQTRWERPVLPSLPQRGGAVSRRFGAAAARADADARGQRRPVPTLEPGDRVLHDSFGMGSVVALSGSGENAVASIDFGSLGVKRLLLRYAPVEKI
jgi:DNA helicase-2/ATP-dependent DNA helicase PcrA